VTAEQMRQCKQRMNTFCLHRLDPGQPSGPLRLPDRHQRQLKFQTRGIAGAADDAVGITPKGSVLEPLRLGRRCASTSGGAAWLGWRRGYPGWRTQAHLRGGKLQRPWSNSGLGVINFS